MPLSCTLPLLDPIKLSLGSICSYERTDAQTMKPAATNEHDHPREAEPQDGEPDGGVPVLDLSSREAHAQTADDIAKGEEKSEKTHELTAAVQNVGPEQSANHAVESQSDYSVFTVAQKRAIIVTGSFAGWFSPMTGSIYFPALNSSTSSGRHDHMHHADSASRG